MRRVDATSQVRLDCHLSNIAFTDIMRWLDLVTTAKRMFLPEKPLNLN